VQDFKRLKVWQRAHALGLDVHRVDSTFPKVGFGELRLQITSSADSIASCIAEGSAASTQREFARYLDMAIRSVSETEHHLICAHGRGAIGAARHRALSKRSSRFDGC
jgi:four helix bundle protein